MDSDPEIRPSLFLRLHCKFWNIFTSSFFVCQSFLDEINYLDVFEKNVVFDGKTGVLDYNRFQLKIKIESALKNQLLENIS